MSMINLHDHRGSEVSLNVDHITAVRPSGTEKAEYIIVDTLKDLFYIGGWEYENFVDEINRIQEEG